MTTDQVKGILDRVIAIALAYAVGRGIITEGAALYWGPVVVGLLSAVYGWWVNRPKAIVQSAAALPAEEGKKTVVITSFELAQSTPETNIVSSITAAQRETQRQAA